MQEKKDQPGQGDMGGQGKDFPKGDDLGKQGGDIGKKGGTGEVREGDKTGKEPLKEPGTEKKY